MRDTHPVADVVDVAPPLTGEQRDRLAALLPADDEVSPGETGGERQMVTENGGRDASA
jgi:hypothetical protein